MYFSAAIRQVEASNACDTGQQGQAQSRMERFRFYLDFRQLQFDCCITSNSLRRHLHSGRAKAEQHAAGQFNGLKGSGQIS
jgi:hypothetical protein